MSELLEINVVDEDINLGVRDNCEKCPINRAAMREVEKRWPGRFMTHTEQTIIEIFELPRQIRTICLILPPIAVQFIDDFDRGGLPAPFSFSLELDEDDLEFLNGSDIDE